MATDETQTEWSRRGGRLAAQNMTPEQRRARALKASLAGSVSQIDRRAAELTLEQREIILSALSR
ncbi:MAG: hypothetical protein ACOYBY_18620 [Dermatophilaceae bacterium]